MKKILFLAVAILFSVSCFAQQPSMPKKGQDRERTASSIVKKNNGKKAAKSLPKNIKAKDLTRSLKKILNERKGKQPRIKPGGAGGSQRADKPYQLIMVMNASNQTTWGAVDDNRKKLEEEIRKGTLARAALLYSREDGKTYIKMLLPEDQTVEFGTNWSDEPEVPYIEVDLEGKRPGEILADFLSSFENKDEYYTMVHVTFHGAGHSMISYIKEKQLIMFPTFVKILASTKLKIDVLNLESCLMGTVDNMEILFNEAPVKYLIAGSNVRIDLQSTSRKKEDGSRQIGSEGSTPILDFFDKKPKDLVNAYVAQKGTKSVGKTGFSHNVMGISSERYKQTIHPLLVSWAKKVNATYASSIQWEFQRDIYPGTSFPSALEQVAKLAANDKELKEKTEALRKVQFEPIMSYACWDGTTGEKVNDVKNTNGHRTCMAGFTIDAFSLRILAGEFHTAKELAEAYRDYMKDIYAKAKEAREKREEEVRRRAPQVNQRQPKTGNKPQQPKQKPAPKAKPAASAKK